MMVAVVSVSAAVETGTGLDAGTEAETVPRAERDRRPAGVDSHGERPITPPHCAWQWWNRPGGRLHFAAMPPPFGRGFRALVQGA